ncbi:hypothetical protein ACIB24_03695 [Spongisporangium articulatum]|uniref:Uncharacterized protein n=1 Tax=Spongisporangium articulatum TaxID=3362603 RepID=A0ABW8AIG8_9ACTN
MQQGRTTTAVLWAVALGAHVALDVLTHRLGAGDFAGATLLPYLAISLGVQREMVRTRAFRVPIGSAG